MYQFACKGIVRLRMKGCVHGRAASFLYSVPSVIFSNDRKKTKRFKETRPDRDKFD